MGNRKQDWLWEKAKLDKDLTGEVGNDWVRRSTLIIKLGAGEREKGHRSEATREN